MLQTSRKYPSKGLKPSEHGSDEVEDRKEAEPYRGQADDHEHQGWDFEWQKVFAAEVEHHRAKGGDGGGARRTEFES